MAERETMVCCSSRVRIAVVSSVHHWNDTRIFVREAASLAANGYQVVHVGVGTERSTFDRGGVKVHTLPRRRRALRWITWLDILCIVLAERASVVHVQDPELIPLALLLKLTGRKAICDIHEDLAEQILYKEWIPRSLRPFLARAARLAQRFLPRLANAVIVAEDSYVRNFPKAANVSVVRNFPILPPFCKEDYATTVLRLIYVGDVRRVRGISEYVAITDRLVKRGIPVQLRVVGGFADPSEESQIRRLVHQLGLERRIALLGRRPPDDLFALLVDSDVGLALLHSIGNYRQSYPTKMFEYMAAGLPVVVSHFPLWESVVLGSACGQVVNPLDVDAATDALVVYWNSRDLRERHGRNGRKAAAARYQWATELPNLLGVYADLLKQPKPVLDH